MKKSILVILLLSAFQLLGILSAGSYIPTSYNQSSTAIILNVSHVVAQPVHGLSPSDMITATTAKGFYRVGIAYDWGPANYSVIFRALPNPTYRGFVAVYGDNLFGSLNATPLSGPVNVGDSIEISMYLDNGMVNMAVNDITTGAHFNTSYPTFGAALFNSENDQGINLSNSGTSTVSLGISVATNHITAQITSNRPPHHPGIGRTITLFSARTAPKPRITTLLNNSFSFPNFPRSSNSSSKTKVKPINLSNETIKPNNFTHSGNTPPRGTISPINFTLPGNILGRRKIIAP